MSGRHTKEYNCPETCETDGSVCIEGKWCVTPVTIDIDVDPDSGEGNLDYVPLDCDNSGCELRISVHGLTGLLTDQRISLSTCVTIYSGYWIWPDVIASDCSDDFFVTYIDEDISGCTDPCAENYNAGATFDDGSCEYITLPEYNAIEVVGDLIPNTIGFPFNFNVNGLSNISILLNQSIYGTNPDEDEDAENLNDNPNIFGFFNSFNYYFSGVPNALTYFSGNIWDDFGAGFTIQSQLGFFVFSTDTVYLKWNLDGFDETGNYVGSV